MGVFVFWKGPIKNINFIKTGTISFKNNFSACHKGVNNCNQVCNKGVNFAVNAWDFGFTILLSQMSSISGPKSKKTGMVGPVSWYLWMGT